jgi:MoaA/NifB/PqqE/SkfB family radical SAM enzyme
MCLPYIEGSTVNGSHMEPEAFEKVARALFPVVERFQLTVSGEPLMSKGLGRMLELAEEYGVRAEYYTNGTLLNDRMIATILPTLGDVCVSFDGATKATFEYLREGASFERVLEGVERLAKAIQALPEKERPTMGLAVTVMERNVRELPALVELAHRLGLDFVGIAHVFPVIEEMQRQSLAHHVELAKEWIGKALARGRELGIPVTVQPLDQVIVAMADAARPSGTQERAVATADGVVEGLGERAVNRERRRHPPGPPVVTDAARAHVAARPRRRRRAESIPAPVAAPPQPESIWWCDFLWNRIYVTAEGIVRPCCVPGVPDVADFRKDDLATIWDNEAYRAMRVGLVRKDPVPVCKGCQHVRQTSDPAEIARLLQGRSLPEPVPVPMILRPVVDAASVAVYGTLDRPIPSSAAPTVTWPAVPDASGYEFEGHTMSAGKVVRYDTAPRGIDLPLPSIAIPDWVWNHAPAGVPVEWRAIARLPRSRVVVARGVLVRV